MGPNDMLASFGSMVSFFFFLLSFSITNYCIVSFLMLTYEVRTTKQAAITKQAHGEFFFLLSFSVTDYCIVSFFLMLTYEVRMRKRAAMMKRAQTTCLVSFGPMVSFFFSLRLFLLLITVLFLF